MRVHLPAITTAITAITAITTPFPRACGGECRLLHPAAQRIVCVGPHWSGRTAHPLLMRTARACGRPLRAERPPLSTDLLTRRRRACAASKPVHRAAPAAAAAGAVRAPRLPRAQARATATAKPLAAAWGLAAG